MNRPAGRISAICGVRREIRSMSARPNSIPASPASAGRWRHAFVEPPSAAATAIAFSNDAFVRIAEGRRSCSSASTRTAAARPDDLPRVRDPRRRATPCPGTVRPSASETLAIVFAVYMLAHEPLPGSATHSSSVSSSRLILPVACAPIASYTSWIETSRPRKQPGRIEPPYANTDRQVEPDHRHHHPGQRLVAAGDREEPVHPLGVDDELDRVGDPVARRQRGAHALGAHRDPVGDRDRVEEERQHAQRPQLVASRDGELVEVHVAGRDPVPGRRHAGLRQLQVLGRPAHRAQHRAGGRLRRPARHLEAALPAAVGRCSSSSSTTTCSSAKKTSTDAAKSSRVRASPSASSGSANARSASSRESNVVIAIPSYGGDSPVEDVDHVAAQARRAASRSRRARRSSARGTPPAKARAACGRG